MLTIIWVKALLLVALRLECVDRNPTVLLSYQEISVALRLECVDRNILLSCKITTDAIVALRLECVDRNSPTLADVECAMGRTPFGVRG